ncbi:MAG: PKD domain-containing protein [Bacteroidota bacterium]
MSFFRVYISCPLKIGIVTLLLLLTGWRTLSFAQSGNCDPQTPFFNVDLSSDPNGSWTSPTTTREDYCCLVTGSDRCIEFLVTLSPDAVAVNFGIAVGANPPGWFYQINCGVQTPLGSPICLNGPGPYTVTFCKAGANANTYKITSIAEPTPSPDLTVGNGCTIQMSTSGLINSTISWNSIFPGAVGAYNSYLSCASACDSTVVSSLLGHPAYIDYRVCGTPAGGPCVPPGQFCDTIRVNMPPPLLNTAAAAVFCSNNPSVLIAGTVNGGVPPYTFAWTNAANGGGTVVGTNQNYTATAVGTYSFIVYDQNYPACPAPITNVTVTSSPAPAINAGPDQSPCGNSVTLAGVVTGATGGIWSGGSGIFFPLNTSANATYTPTLAERTSGTLVLTFTSTGNGACSPVSDQVVLSLTTPIVVTISPPTVICFGQTVTITANYTGGTAPFTYLWNTGETTQTLTNVQPGTHSVMVTGGSPGFCTGTASVTLTANPQIFVTTSPNNAITCSATATISATGTGGTGTINYLWSNGAATASTNVNTGTYIITVTDAVGCTATNSVSISAGSTLAATLNQPAVLCNGASTSLTATVSGGLGSHSFLWSNGATTASITIGAGTYNVTVTDSIGCVVSAGVTVTENPPLLVSIPAPSIVCNGASATVNTVSSGGQAPYSFLWNTGQTTQSLTAAAGTYTVTVTDMIGCTNTAVVTVSEATVINVTMSNVGVACFGENNGSALATVTGGVSSYFYSWSPYGGASANATGLLANTYTVTVTDAIGCSKIATTIVAQPLVLAASITVQNHVSCNGGTNGAAIANPTGGTSAYSYAWSPIGGGGQTATNLSVGSYTVAITDNKGCTVSAQTNITEPTLLTASIVSTTDVSCNGGSTGSATILASGGTPVYSYSWAPSGGTNATATNLALGSYTVTITDAKSCIKQLTIVINQPPPLTSIISPSTNLTCNGVNTGTATASPTGGTSPYTYLWNPAASGQTTATAINLSAGTYFVTITDNKGCTSVTPTVTITEPTLTALSVTATSYILCDSAITISSSATGGAGGYTYLWSTGATTSSILVNTGLYIVTVTDASGCLANDSVSVIALNSTLSATINQPPNICFGSSTTITVTVTGGLGNNLYLWNTGATTSSIFVGAGSYCVTVTDAGGCKTNECITIVQNPQISVTIGIPPNICPGASATLTAVGSGGQPAYSYLWNSGETTQSLLKPVGSYTVIISDVTGPTCSATASATVIAVAPITTTMNFNNVSCFGAANGTASVNASGGAGGYTYLWAPSGGTNSSVTLLGPGTYTVTSTDVIGCTKIENVTITQPATPVAITLTSTDNLCLGDSNGTATASGSGGVGPYFYYWSINGDTLPTITGLAVGTYSATVADNTGCFISSTVDVSDPLELTFTSTATQINCFGGKGSVGLVAMGGTGILVITGSDTVNLAAGTYNYTVTDANGCSRTTQQIIAPAPPALTLTSAPIQIACFGGTGGVILAAAGGTGALVISGDASINLTAGIYNYMVTDANGCTTNSSATINPVSAVTLTAAATQITCFGGTGSVLLAAAGGTGTLVISGDGTTNLVACTYNYTVTDSNGCTANASAIINVAPPIVALTATALQISCFGGSGSVGLIVSGGTGILTITGDDTTNLLAGTYNYTVTDSNGCVGTDQVIINTAPQILTIAATASQISCFGGTGSVGLVTAGGTGALAITGGGTTNLLAGTYNYTVTDAKGCTATAQAIINTAPPILTLTASAAQISCFGGTGSVSLIASGGTGTLTITGNDTTNLVAGTYNYTVTDANGCTANASATINAAPSVVSLTATATQITCFAGGSVALVSSGGTGTLTISGDNTTNLIAGTYNYTVTDANGCIATAQAVINPQPLVPTLTATATQIACFGGTGSVALLASGGTGTLTISGDATTNLLAGTYNYTVTDGTGCISTAQSIINTQPPIVTLTALAIQISCFGGTGSIGLIASGGTGTLTITGDDTTNLIAGTYNYTVTDTKGCPATASATINAAPPLLTLSATATQISCFGGKGSVVLLASGGTGTLTISGDSIVNLLAGTYNYTVTDGNGCIATAQAIINPAPPVLTLTSTASQISCFGGTGSVVLLAAGGTGALVISGDAITSLLAGTYNYTVTDSKGCTAVSQEIINTQPPLLTLTSTPLQINCFGGTGSVGLIAAGGTGTLIITGDDTLNLVSGTYNYIVTDSNGCTANASAVINAAPSLVTLSATATQITCFGGTGTVLLASSGGTGTLTITGDATANLLEGTYNYTVTDANACFATAQAIIDPAPSLLILSSTTVLQITCFGGTASLGLMASGGTGALVITGDDTTNLIAGTYNYTVTDSNGCIATEQVIINTQPTIVALTTNPGQIGCFGGTGSVGLVPSGGTMPYAITGDDTLNLIAGTYNYTVTDTNGCIATASATINVEPSLVILSATVTQISCFGGTGSVILASSGGTGTLSITGDATTNLFEGTYNYAITDANGCTATTQATIDPEPSQLTLSSTSVLQISCFGGTGSVGLIASGGIGTLTITGDDTTNLAAGTYNYTVADSNGCIATEQVIINTQPTVVSVTIAPVNVSCFGGTDGTATAIGSGGTAPYNYVWQHGDSVATTTGLIIGTYSVTVSDDMGCLASSSVVISEPSPITLTGNTVASTCSLNNGSATVAAVGGTGAYTYSWSPSGGTAALASNLYADDYTVTVTDINACQNQISLTVALSSFLIANFSATAGCLNDPIIFTDSSSTSIGSTITSWTWDFGNFSPINNTQNPSYTYTASGSYNASLTVTATNGCVSISMHPVTVHFSPFANFVSSKACIGSPTLFTDLSTVTGNDTISSWLWDFDDLTASDTIQDPTHSYTLPGTYNAVLLVTNNHGCTDSIQILTIVNPSPLVQFIVNDSSGCVIHCPQFADTSDPLSGTITGWQWDFGDGSPFGTNPNEGHCYANSGLYAVTLTATTSNGCFSSITQTDLVNVYPAPMAEFDYNPQPPTSLSAEIYFNNLSAGASSWSWNFGDVNDSTASFLEYPMHNYVDVGNYCITLVAQNNYQCLDTVVHCLKIEPEFTFFIPNSFTPNDSEGTNDGFSGFGTNISQYDMWIFDRWGNMIFHTADLYEKWNGKARKGAKIAQRDVYVYLVVLLDFRGTEHQYRGTVTLAR